MIPYTQEESSFTSLQFRTRGLNFAILVDEDDRSFLKVNFAALTESRRLLCHVELLLPAGVGLERVF